MVASFFDEATAGGGDGSVDWIPITGLTLANATNADSFLVAVTETTPGVYDTTVDTGTGAGNNPSNKVRWNLADFNEDIKAEWIAKTNPSHWLLQARIVFTDPPSDFSSNPYIGIMVTGYTGGRGHYLYTFPITGGQVWTSHYSDYVILQNGPGSGGLPYADGDRVIMTWQPSLQNDNDHDDTWAHSIEGDGSDTNGITDNLVEYNSWFSGMGLTYSNLSNLEFRVVFSQQTATDVGEITMGFSLAYRLVKRPGF